MPRLRLGKAPFSKRSGNKKRLIFHGSGLDRLGRTFDVTGAAMSSLTRLVRHVLAAGERAIANQRPRYEPAEHYMRGPGPKCREKERLGSAD
jgi:hypothetical protein